MLALSTLGAGPLSAGAQQAGKVRRIGYLSAPSRASVEHLVQVFLRALRGLGWVEGQNLIIEYLWADGKVDQLPPLAAEMVRRNVELIVAPAGHAVLAAKNATGSIPVVMVSPGDPVAMGLVASLRRPGGNVTGTTSKAGVEMYGKQLQLLQEAVPHAVRVAYLWNPASPTSAVQLKEVEAAARSLRIRIQSLETRGPAEFDSVFAAVAREQAQALLIADDSMFLTHRTRVAELATKGRLPMMANYREIVQAGGLMAYAVNLADVFTLAAGYVDRILKGAKPADMPVQQPTKFEFIINMKTAKALGITIPYAILLRADQVIE